MNKRIQKKVAKREQEQHQQPGSGQREVSALKIAARPPRSVVHAHAQPEESTGQGLQSFAQKARELVEGQTDAGPLGAVRAVAEQVQERTAEAIDQVRSKISETEAQLKERIAETEERAEALLEKVPLVGGVAARKLHDLTHR